MLTLSALGYAASIATHWQDFTPQHARRRDLALGIALGNHPVPAGAVVGVYGSGKSTLLFDVLTRVSKQGVFPVWEEACSFLDRLVPSTERVSPQEFVVRVHAWLGALRTESSAFAAYKADLAKRQLLEVADLIQGSLQASPDRIVLFLDEMEQAYASFLQRIEAADHQPLRALIDSCAGSSLRLLMAYAPESFITLGDADQGRMARIAVPSLSASSIQQFFRLEKRHANFAWWASRGRARGVTKVVNEVIQPYLSGEFSASWLGMAEALDALPSVFGVPAVLRDSIPVERLKDLLDLVPHRDPGSPPAYFISIQDRPTLGQRLLDELVRVSRARPEDVEVIVDELLDTLDAVADDDHRCALTFQDFAAAVKLATSRAIESGRIGGPPERIDPAPAFFAIAKQANEGWNLPFSLSELADGVFPSPFTDPVLPLSGGRIPAPDEIEKLFADSGSTVLQWQTHECLILRDTKSLGNWLVQELPKSDENSCWRILLLDNAESETGAVALASEAGRIAVRGLNRFHSSFLKCISIRAGQAQLGNELEDIALAFHNQDRQIGRKVDWHLSRIGRLLDEMDPVPGRRWRGAVTAARGEKLTGVFGRLGEDSPGLLALLYTLKGCRSETRKILAELSEILGENSELRGLARGVEGRKQLEGAAVVVDELLPARQGAAKRWVDGDFPGRTELNEIFDSYASTDAAVLAKLLNPHQAARLDTLVRFHSGQLPDLRPERQQLDGLQGINAVMNRARAIHKGIQSLLGSKADIAGLVIGKMVGKALGAQKAIQMFNRLTERFEKIDEPWAKALALWVAAVFAERIWTGVERDEAQLKAWEAIADDGKDLGKAIDAKLEELDDQGFAGVRDYLTLERGRAKAGLYDPDQMRGKLLELEATVTDIAELARVLGSFKDLVSDHGVDVCEPLRAYRPEGGRITEDVKLADQVITMVNDVHGDWPAPASEELRPYLRKLEEFGRQSRSERLRSRLLQVVQLPVISRDIRLDVDDVTQIEEEWPKLNEEFSHACKDAIETSPPSGSDTILNWIREALEKQLLLASVPQDIALSVIDEKTRSWATRMTVRPNQLSEVLQSRARARQLLANLCRAVNGSVIGELLKISARALPDEAQATLEREAVSFQEELEKRASRLAAATGNPGARPFSGDSMKAVLSALDEAASAAEHRVTELHKRVLALNNLVEHLGGRAYTIPSPLALPEATRLVQVASERAKKLLEEQWHALAARLEQLGVDPSVLGRYDNEDEIQAAASLEDAREWFGTVELEAQSIVRMGLVLPVAESGSREEIAEAIRSVFVEGRRRLQELNEAIRVARLRLARMVTTQVPLQPEQFDRISDAQSALVELKQQAEEARILRLSGASERARKLYTMLVSGKDVPNPELKALAELRRLGLVRTIEDEL